MALAGKVSSGLAAGQGGADGSEERLLPSPLLGGMSGRPPEINVSMTATMATVI